jgi:hypothetical protein
MEIINQILEAKHHWLYKDNEELNRQIQLTIDAGFEKSDVFHALRWVHRQVTEEHLKNWYQVISNDNVQPKKVLFFHAGNLPLVGFQDVIAALLSGHHYLGKLSRKDPYLLKGFLDTFKKITPSYHLKYSSDVVDFYGEMADALVFSGSEKSSKEIVQICTNQQMIQNNAKQLIRTAHFSVAVIDDRSPKTMEDLVEAVLRYKGEGCRSVKLIIAPFDLYDHSCEVTDYVESWWTNTKRGIDSLSDGGSYYYAYYRSLGKPMMKWENKVVIQTMPSRLETDVVYWIKGDKSILDYLRSRYGNQIQTIYYSSVNDGKESELLEKAQFPDLNWKPDGVDVLQWLKNI